MVARKQNIVIEQGATTHLEFQLYDANNDPLLDTAGYTGVAHLRQSWEANAIYTFDTSIGTNGILYLDMVPLYSNTVPANNYYYDIFLIGANTQSKIIEGMVTVQAAYSLAVYTPPVITEQPPPEIPPPTFSQSVYLVATLPPASTVGVGARTFVLDATNTAFGTIVMGGGPYQVPVYSDGFVYRIG
jgi:hypothetical protein